MILVDTSAFIEYYRPGGDPEVGDAVADAIASGEIAVNGIIEVEILAFAPGRADLERLRADFQAFHHTPITDREYDLAVDLGFTLRREGLTVPATDLIIAASAIGVEATLFHVDDHYDRIGEHSDLKARHL